MYDRETMNHLRGYVTRMVVTSHNDNGAVQKVDGIVRRDEAPTSVEVYQPFGFASAAPSGGVTLVFAVGGSQDDLVALPVGHPEWRLGNLPAGATAIYSTDGSRVMITAEGEIDAVCTTRGRLRVRDQAEVEVTEDMVRGRLPGPNSRFVARPNYVKLAFGASDWLVVKPGQILCSVPPIVGPDPEPSV